MLSSFFWKLLPDKDLSAHCTPAQVDISMLLRLQGRGKLGEGREEEEEEEEEARGRRRRKSREEERGQVKVGSEVG